MYKLKYRRQARNYLARLPLKTKTVIVNKLNEIAIDPEDPSHDIDVLKGREGFRLRVGQYRILYIRQDDQLVIEVVKVRSRGDIYKR
ncbi:MAG TPA: type II toxin-antitoxin system RelE/ParE family toxin [Deltaproteobacteria bacterium]|nr:type II toxin-antitoxin system RelE/ParE family toxin [Deltaproteobacteria bacterium]